VWGIWYGATRFLLETFREGWNWTLGGIATAQIVSLIVIAIGVALIAWNHRPGRAPEPAPIDLAAVPPSAPTQPPPPAVEADDD
jgi:prolipoprotein diacylglyceryltransferase